MKVKLLSKTKNMFRTIWEIWHASRSNDPVELDVPLKHLPGAVQSDVKNLFFRILEEDIPIAEMIDFIFLLEDIPISLREQLVRHRIGVKVDDRLGMDYVPNLADSSFWSQSMRVLDMSNFGYFIPESIGKATPIVVVGRHKIPAAVYNEAMANAARAYSALIESGIPKEDARNVIPLGAVHRIVWKLNLAALKHIVSKRGCWILQLGLWMPIIVGIVDELAQIDKRFRNLICPPCIKKENFIGCNFCENNTSRIVGDVDKLPPCPLYLNYYRIDAEKIATSTSFEASKNESSWYFIREETKGCWGCCDESKVALMEQMRKDYQELWGRNVDTGELL